MKPIVPSPTATTLAAKEIRDAISTGKLAPGSRLRQEELAARLGVSREPIRKALLLLEREGSIHVVKNGAIVAPLDRRFITEIFELRETIESYVVARITKDQVFDVSSLRSLIVRGHKAAEEGLISRLTDLDEAFHRELYRASGNRIVVDIMQTHWSHIRRIMSRATSQRSRKQIWNEHQAILDAIGKKETSLARNLITRHVRAALKAALDTLREKASD